MPVPNDGSPADNTRRAIEIARRLVRPRPTPSKQSRPKPRPNSVPVGPTGPRWNG